MSGGGARLVGRREGYLLITMVTYLLPLGSVPVTSSWSRTSPGTPVGNPSQFSTKRTFSEKCRKVHQKCVILWGALLSRYVIQQFTINVNVYHIQFPPPAVFSALLLSSSVKIKRTIQKTGVCEDL